MNAKLTVLIPCKNERYHIRDCIESARDVADEILVADSGSTDETRDLVLDAGGCRLIEREFIGYTSFKNWAIPQASHEWVLIVDADERITPELTAEIRALLRDPPAERNAYLVRRRTFFMGRELKHSGLNHETVTRLIRRDACRYRQVRVHEEIDVARNRLGELRQAMLHYSFHSYSELMAKMTRYARLSAEDAKERGKRPSALKMFLNAPLRFFLTYVVRRGFLDGLPGLQVCALSAFGSFLKQASLWELYHAPPRKEPLPERIAPQVSQAA